MSKIKAIAVDDEPDALEVLKLVLKQIPEIDLIAVACSANEAIDCIQEQQPELVFLDVEMPVKNGFDVIRAFKSPSFKVIFTTAFDQYAIQAIKCAALDYLLKPINTIEMGEAIERFHESRELEDTRLSQLNINTGMRQSVDRIIIASKKGFITLELASIVSIESMRGNYAFFYMDSGRKYLCTKPMGYYEEILEGHGFYRCHRSYIVNLNQVQFFDNRSREVVTKDQRTLPVAARRVAGFKREIERG